MKLIKTLDRFRPLWSQPWGPSRRRTGVQTSSSHSALKLAFVGFLLTTPLGVWAQDSTVLTIEKETRPGLTPPIPVALSGFTGEVEQVLKFDLYVVGFAFTTPDQAQFLISGSNNGHVQGRLTDRHGNATRFTREYPGASLRRQAHTFADDIVHEITSKNGIALTRIACKVETGNGNGEIYVADYDGHNPQAVTRDNTIVAAPCWVPGRSALYYTSYKLNNADIFYHDLATGARRVFAGYGGSNLSPAASPGGAEVAMILSKDGWTDLYVGNASGGLPRRLTKSPQDESSPCWSPDGRWICYASKDREHRALCKISAAGGSPIRISTSGMPNPTEPDWSPDGKWIAFTSQYRSGFSICVVPADGLGSATQLVEGEDPSWAPNSRTLIYARRQGGHYVLSLLDMPTKQTKDLSRITGSSNSQPSWAK